MMKFGRAEVLGRITTLGTVAKQNNYQGGWIFYTLVSDYPFLGKTEWFWLAGFLNYSSYWATAKIEQQRNAEEFGNDRWGRGATNFMNDAFADYWQREYQKYRDAYFRATGRYPDESTKEVDAAAYAEGANFSAHQGKTHSGKTHEQAREEWAKSHTYGSSKRGKTKTKTTAETIDVRERDALKLLKLVKPFTKTELKSAFRAMAKKLHPDMDGGDAEKFRKVNDAYNYLLGKVR